MKQTQTTLEDFFTGILDDCKAKLEDLLDETPTKCDDVEAEVESSPDITDKEKLELMASRLIDNASKKNSWQITKDDLEKIYMVNSIIKELEDA